LTSEIEGEKCSFSVPSDSFFTFPRNSRPGQRFGKTNVRPSAQQTAELNAPKLFVFARSQSGNFNVAWASRPREERPPMHADEHR
jgi:hypothetical protein